MASGGLVELTQGAEAKIYRTTFLGIPAVVKLRISKPYRHPEYDRVFKHRRTLIEAKVMTHLRSLGVRAPSVLYVDPDAGLIVMEYIDGCRLSECLSKVSIDRVAEIALDIGRQTSIMHVNSVYHGDLTLANTLISYRDEVYIIDFGLSGYSKDVEEYAIDVHLLDRSVELLYPELKNTFMNSFWKGYLVNASASFVEKLKDKVRDVRLRGRYVEERLRKRISKDKYA